MLNIAAGFLLAAIALDGVTGERLRAHAFFDSNNVRLGDPMVLTVEFIGSAEFADLHPPALSREVNRAVWKVDDRSAKTDTYQNARRLVYRVRPMKEGVIEFPALEFSYTLPRGGEAKTATIPLPVHVKPGAQAALAGLEDDVEGLPMPDGLHLSLAAGPWGSAEAIGEDGLFRWRRACRSPKAESFAAFGFPEARLNEAACSVVEGNWAKALRIYTSLEWRIGQTPEIERGIVAALSRRAGAAVELPVWRQALRPVLRRTWVGRVLTVLGAFAVLFALVKLAGRAIRALACAAFALLSLGAFAQGGAGARGRAIDPFAEVDRMMERMFSGADSFFGTGPGGVTVNGRPQPKIEVGARVKLSRTDIRVGEPFEFVLELEGPKAATFDQVRLTPSEMYGLAVLGAVKNLPDAASPNPSNVIHRTAFPVRYDVPFSSPVGFRVEGMVTGRVEMKRRGGGRSTYQFSQSFGVECPPVEIRIMPLPSDGQPKDFSGVIGTGFSLRQSVDLDSVETNDVVKVTTMLEFMSGFAPQGAVANEIERRPGRIAWERYFVADGAAKVPDDRFTVYDTAKRGYRTLMVSGARLKYRAAEATRPASVAVDAAHSGADAEDLRALRLRFAPSDDAAVVATVRPGVGDEPSRCEVSGEWTRLEAASGAGWVRTEELE